MRTIKITPEIEKALEEQRKLFIKKFGREPRPDDPVFFNPDKCVPAFFTDKEMETYWLKGMVNLKRKIKSKQLKKKLDKFTSWFLSDIDNNQKLKSKGE